MARTAHWALFLSLTAPVLAAEPLVDGNWLQARLGDPETVVLDIRNRIGKGSKAVYAQGHIPGAIHTDYLEDGWRTKVDGVPGMLPPTEALERLVGSLGIDNDSHVVVVPAGVSAADYGSATRVYWTLKVLGHDRVSVLDGGYAGWVAAGRTVDGGIVEPEPATFRAELRPELVASRDDVRKVLSNGTARLVDNRVQAQFVGKSKHKKASRAGAIPTAVSIPRGLFFDAETGRFADRERLAALWREAGLEDRELVTYCNTGHLASLGWFASSELLGNEQARLYDGSMADWSAHDDLPMVNSGR